MNKEDKELLLRDLCARLPYGVKIHIGKTQRIEVFGDINLRIGSINNTYADIKPYLFPISSMTKEQKREYHQSTSKDIDILQDVIVERINGINNTNKHAIAYNGIDWLNAHHFDYRGLIEKGLAIDATRLNIYKERIK